MSHENENHHEGVNRRDALKTIAAGVGVVASLPLVTREALARHGGLAPGAAAPGGPRFFAAEEYRAVEALADVIIPSDSRSRGARAARVQDYIDVVVGESPAETQALWREGLAWLERAAQEAHGRPFADLEPEAQAAIVRTMSGSGEEARTVAERFFRESKNRAIQGYYTSQIGIHEDLRYQGNAFLLEFPGCEHPEHRSGPAE